MQKHHLKTLESSANSLTNMLFTRWSHWLKTFSLGIWCYFDPRIRTRPEARTCATLPMAIADTSGPAWDLIGHWGHHPRAQHGKGWSEGHSVCVPAKHQQPATGGGGRWTALVEAGFELDVIKKRLGNPHELQGILDIQSQPKWPTDKHMCV